MNGAFAILAELNCPYSREEKTLYAVIFDISTRINIPLFHITITNVLLSTAASMQEASRMQTELVFLFYLPCNYINGCININNHHHQQQQRTLSLKIPLLKLG